MKFRQGSMGRYSYPNLIVAYEVVVASIAGLPAPTKQHIQERYKDVYLQDDRALMRAHYSVSQMITDSDLPASRLTQNSRGKLAFSLDAPKIAAFYGGWKTPDAQHSYLVTDIHMAHGMMPHLNFSPRFVYDVPEIGELAYYRDDIPPKGARMVRNRSGRAEKLRSLPSEVVEMGEHSLHALFDYVARVVHTSRGLSPNVFNAAFIHRGQATQWGEEQIMRPDITDATEEQCYPPSDGTTRRALQDAGLIMGAMKDDNFVSIGRLYNEGRPSSADSAGLSL